jgi:hypothetical protein
MMQLPPHHIGVTRLTPLQRWDRQIENRQSSAFASKRTHPLTT